MNSDYVFKSFMCFILIGGCSLQASNRLSCLEQAQNNDGQAIVRELFSRDSNPDQLKVVEGHINMDPRSELWKYPRIFLQVTLDNIQSRLKTEDEYEDENELIIVKKFIESKLNNIRTDRQLAKKIRGIEKCNKTKDLNVKLEACVILQQKQTIMKKLVFRDTNFDEFEVVKDYLNLDDLVEGENPIESLEASLDDTLTELARGDLWLPEDINMSEYKNGLIITQKFLESMLTTIKNNPRLEAILKQR